jgi:hypothetical protein
MVVVSDRARRGVYWTGGPWPTGGTVEVLPPAHLLARRTRRQSRPHRGLGAIGTLGMAMAPLDTGTWAV